MGSKVNPADEASRGLRAEEFLTHGKWIKGPEFLYLSGKEWPVSDIEPTVIPADDLEVKRESAVYAIVKHSEDPTHCLINYFSSWRKLKTNKREKNLKPLRVTRTQELTVLLNRNFRASCHAWR